MNQEFSSFKLKPEEIRKFISGMGYCYASRRITAEGMKVGYMYREIPDSPTDSGWRFFSGTETQEEVDNPDNIGIYDVNTIANYDASILPFLNAELGTSLERIGDAFKVI
jgi:hypothetical protein